MRKPAPEPGGTWGGGLVCEFVSFNQTLFNLQDDATNYNVTIQLTGMDGRGGWGGD